MFEVAIIGAGEIGSKIAEKIVEKRLFNPQEIMATRRNKNQLKGLSKRLGIATTTDNVFAAKNSRIILLAVRPDQMQGVLDEICLVILEEQIIVSVAVGLKLGFYEKCLGKNEIVRVMPNPFIESCAGLIGYSKNNKASIKTIEKIKSLFGPLCDELIEVNDSEMDTFTALTSSSAALFYLFFDSIAKESKQNGFDYLNARKIILATISSASKHAQTMNTSFKEMIDSASTPGGMTIEGMKELDDKKVSESIASSFNKIIKKSELIGLEGEK